MDLVRSHAASLVASNPDIIVVVGGRIVPVLNAAHSLYSHCAARRERPGRRRLGAKPGSGNVTGFTGFELSMLGKSLEILKQIAPAVVRVALIYNPDNPNSVYYRRISGGASARLAIETVDHPIHNLGRHRSCRCEPCRSWQQRHFLSTRHHDQQTARRRRCSRRTAPRAGDLFGLFFREIGGLAFYGPARTDLFRCSAGYVDRILRGEKPGDLPFQQPTKYELIINRKAAKALDLELPPALLTIADEVIE
jgi:putative ABC transport system substrate-binding protein